MDGSTVKVPTLTGRAAFVGIIAVAALSFWVLEMPRLDKLGLAGGAIVIGLLKTYRSSLVEITLRSDTELGPARARLRRILNAGRLGCIAVGMLAIAMFVIELNYLGGSLRQPWVVGLGVVGVVLILVRELLSTVLAGNRFRKPA